MTHVNNVNKSHPDRASKDFYLADRGLHWNRLDRKTLRICSSCMAEVKGVCQVSGSPIPQGNRCIELNKAFFTWQRGFTKERA